MSRYTKVYGWDELNTCSYGVYSLELLRPPKFDEDGKVTSSTPDGEWFKNFSVAKNEQLKAIERKIVFWRDVKADVRKQKLRNIE